MCVYEYNIYIDRFSCVVVVCVCLISYATIFSHTSLLYILRSTQEANKEIQFQVHMFCLCAEKERKITLALASRKTNICKSTLVDHAYGILTKNPLNSSTESFRKSDLTNKTLTHTHFHSEF